MSNPAARRIATSILALGGVSLGLAWACALVGPATAMGQVPGAGAGPGAIGVRPTSTFHPDSSFAAETLLRNAATQVRAGQWAEALDLYQKVIDQHGDAVAQVPRTDAAADPRGESLLFVEARRHCQRLLAGLPPEARVLYRRRVDARAEALYRRGLEAGDESALRQVVESYFGSARGDDAANALGDLAFRRGRFAEALDAYRLLVPDSLDDPNALVHPDADVDLGRVAAKKLLCRAALGSDRPGPAGLENLAADYPDARGRLAGRDGALATVVGQALADDDFAPAPERGGRWPTFAGAPERTRVAPGGIDVGDFQWQVRLDDPEAARTQPEPDDFRRFNRIAAPTAPKGPELVYHPIVVGDQVVVCDDDEITAYRLDGRPASSEEETRKGLTAWRHRRPKSYATRPARGTATGSFSLTAHGDHIYARLGSVGRGGGTIVAIQNSREVEGKLLWDRDASSIALPKRRPDGADRFLASFEGTPIADDRHVYVALTEAATETWAYVACLDADTGATVWVRYLGNASSAFDPMRNQRLGSDVGHRLLSLDGPTLYYQTNMGVVAALDSETGAVRWMATYPTRDPNAGPDDEPRRDLNPAVIHDGLVIVAPDDAPALFAFDAASGRLVWRSQPVPKLVHVLGVANGRLVATGDHVLSFDVRTGALQRVWPEVGGFEGHGRGLLAGDRIFWPTRTEIHVLDQATGGDVHESIPLFQAFGHGGGNLAVGDGYLVVAEKSALVVYCQNSRLIERYRQLIVEQPEQAGHRYQLGRIAEAAGQLEVALGGFEQAAQRARPGDQVDGRPLSEVALARQHGLLMKLGDRDGTAAAWDAAGARFALAVTAARTGREELSARLALATAMDRAGHPDRSVEQLQRLLTDERLNGLAVAADDRRTVRADLLVTDRLAALIQAHGRGLYAAQDRAAEALLHRGQAARDPELLREVGRSYPVAGVAPEALLALGRLCEELGRSSEAVTAYKRLLALAPDDTRRARALWGLADAYEAQGLLGPARDSLARAQARYPEVDLRPFGLDGAAGSLASARLARDPLRAVAHGRTEPDPGLPLARSWDRRFEAEVRPLIAEGTPARPQAARLFAARGPRLSPVDPASGASTWQADLGGEPLWVGLHGARILAATADRLVALDPDDGQVLWSFDPADPKAARKGLDPFARPEPAAAAGAAGAGVPATAAKLHGFRLVGARVFGLRGDRELLAVDAETGQLDWAFHPGARGLNPHLLVTPGRVVLQALPARGLMVLDADTGRLREEFAGDGEPQAWVRDPLALDDDRVVLVRDARTITLFDLERGADVWTYRDTAALPRTAAPRLWSDSGRLVALFGGNVLTRLDLATGTPAWERPVGLGDLSERPEAFALDADRVYCASGSTLAAYALADGARAWQRHLVGPDRGWALALGERCLAAYPAPATPAGAGRPGGAAAAPDDLPVLFCRRDSGVPLQRLVFPAPARSLALQLEAGAAVVATPGRFWALVEAGGAGGAPRP